MHFIVDGHNLIPKIPGMSLQQEEDEMALIHALQIFCRVHRQTVEVYFDRAAHGHAGTRRFGTITAHFVRQGAIADEAIIQRLRKMGKNAAEWTVVSSDRRIQVEARALRAHVLSSEAFAQQVAGAALQEQRNPGEGGKGKMSDAEMGEWLRLFGVDD